MIKNNSLPGDLKNYKVTIDGKDITSFVTYTYIFQELLAPSWTTQLFIEDTNNLLTEVPIKQGSKIEIEVETEFKVDSDDKKTYKFIVSKISDRKFVNAKHYTYTLHGITEEALKERGTRISHAYQNKAPTDIIKSIVEDYLKAKMDKVDKCDNTITHVINNVTPFTAAAQMSKIGVVEKSADLLFYQSDEGKYSIRSLEKLYSDENADITFKLKPSHIRDDKGNIGEDMTLAINKHDWKHYDVMENANAGMMANKTVSYDYMTKEWSEKVFKYGDDNSKDANNKQWDDTENFENEDINITFRAKHTGIHEDDTLFDSQSDWAGSRKSSLMKLEQDKLLIQCSYGAKCWSYLGKSCEIEIPVNQDKDEPYDNLSGKFLIIAVCHVLSSKASFSNYELIKKRLTKKN